MILESPNGVQKDVVDLYGNPFYADLAQAAETLRHAPYWHEGEKAPSRLDGARELVRNSRVILQDDRLATVYGSTKAYDVTGFHCTCPQSQKGPSSWCVHAIAVKLARTLAEQAPRETALPLPPVTVLDRLDTEARCDVAGCGQPALPVAGQALCPAHLQVALALEREDPTHTPEETRMPDDEYTPEPAAEDAPTAVIDVLETMPPVPVKIPREFTVTIKGKVHVLYTGLVVAARASGLVSLAADWTYNDAELSLAHAVCTFADGRRYEESGDATPGNVTRGISLHFRRVALTRAKARCLRDALGISECSVEEMHDESEKREVSVMPPPTNQEYRQRIWGRVKELAPEVTTREAVEAFIKQRTGLALHPENYGTILERFDMAWRQHA